MRIGDFDTNSDALKNRVDLQKTLGSFDLNAWIFSHLSLFDGAACLDLGCGRGNQSIPLAKIIGQSGKLISLDMSQNSLQVMMGEAGKEGVKERIVPVVSGLDDMAQHLTGKKFDCVIGCYSLYYVRDALKMFSVINQHLNHKGQVFFCGPSCDNNSELRRLIADASDCVDVLEPTVASIFMEETSPDICKNIFDEVTVTKFENSVVFPDANSVLTYWKSHNLFDETIVAEVERRVKQHFETYGEFLNTKRGIGILAAKY